MRENLPLGQDLLTYTPIGGCALLPLTVAVDMSNSAEEVEVSRKNDAVVFGGFSFAKITKKGTITITNFRKEKSVMRISMGTGGRVEEVSDDGKIKINDLQASDWQEYGYHVANPHSDISWDLTLEPGVTKVLSYTVTVYTR
jgi:hypothetical protein